MTKVHVHHVMLRGFRGEIEVELSQTVKQLREQLVATLNVPADEMRVMLAGGKLLQDHLSLGEQGVKENSKLMIVKNKAPAEVPTASVQTQPDPTQLNKRPERLPMEEKAAKVRTLFAAARELASREDGGHNEEHFFELYDQNQNAITLPQEQREGLIYGMCLHEKARSEIARQNYDFALQILEEAEHNGFAKVPVEILEAVDNFAYLCLDIAWVYLKLQDVQFLHDAEKRLFIAESCLYRNHGKDLERLLTIKDGACPELVMYVRLNVLKAVVAFHKKDYVRARMRLSEATEQLNNLKVTESEMLPILQMGLDFTPAEIRVAMRSSNKIPDQAVAYLIEKREARRVEEEEARRRIREKRLQKRYGYCMNGEYVNIDYVTVLTQRGFNKRVSVKALKQTNNDVELASSLLTDQPELFYSDKKRQKTLREQNNQASISDSPSFKEMFDDEKVEGLMQLGKPKEQVIAALYQANGDLDSAGELLLLDAVTDELPATVEHYLATGEAPPPSAVSEPIGVPETGIVDEEEEESEENDEHVPRAPLTEEDVERRNAESELVEEFPNDDEAYLAATLDEESELVEMYAAQLTARGY